MELTFNEFGITMNRLRAARGLYASQTAKMLNVSKNDMIRAETGNMEIPPTWWDILADKMRLTTIEQHALRRAMADSTPPTRAKCA